MAVERESPGSKSGRLKSAAAVVEAPDARPPIPDRAAELRRKIENRKVRVGIIGLGYVGLPLALTFSERGFFVTGFDVDQSKIEALSAGRNYIKHLKAEEWKQNAVVYAQCGADPLDPEANPPVIQSMRMIVDLGRFEESRWVLPGGQSGNPLSPHYADQLPLWQRGEGVPIPFTEAQVSSASTRRLSLVPSPA